MDFLPINWQLIGNPVNWAIIILMLLIAGYALHILLPNTFPANELN